MSTWYLGVPGDMRALTCPEPGVSTTVTRYGAVNQGLSGARRMMNFGHRAEFSFRWDYMEKSEWSWMEALHSRHIPGPHRLINPLKNNRLTPDSSSCKIGRAGLSDPFGDTTRVWDWPPGADPGAQSLRWDGWVDNSSLRFDHDKRTVVLPGETITGSVYIKADTATSVYVIFYHFDSQGVSSSSLQELIPITTSWERYSITDTVPAGVATVRFTLFTEGSVTPLFVAAPQVESGPVATEWEQGGGAPVVLTDQLETTSPRYPLTDCSLTLLEA